MSDVAPHWAQNLSLEHIVPRKICKGSQWDTDYPDVDERETKVRLLGNCTLVSKKTNSAAKNRDFAEKKEKYGGDDLLVGDASLLLR